MSSAYLNTSYANLDELSPIDNSGENSFGVNYLPSSYGSQVVPVYYPIPSYYQLYNGVSAVESNGTTYYNYYQFAVPMYCISPDLTTENILTSDVTSVNYPDDFSNELYENVNPDSLSSELTTENISSSDVSSVSNPDDFTDEFSENVIEDSYSDQFTPSSNNVNDVASNGPPEELIDEFTEYYDVASYSDQFTPSSNNVNDVACNDPSEELIDEFTEYYDEARDSSILIPENDVIAEERKNDIKRKKDWLYLLSLSGKLHVKDHIPQVHVMPEILEEEEDVEITEDDDVEISEEILQSGDSLEKELWTDVIPEIDKSDDDQKNPNEDEIKSSYANGAHKEKCPANGVENDLWSDYFYSMDDPVFGIEACFDNSSVKESSDNDLDKKNFNLSSTYGKTFMILTRLNKQIQVLPTIVEEDESVVDIEILDVIVEKTPFEVNKENTIVNEEGCFESRKQNAEKVENNCGLAETTVEVGTSEKPKKKKRFKGIRRFFSELRSCFRKSESPPG